MTRYRDFRVAFKVLPPIILYCTLLSLNGDVSVSAQPGQRLSSQLVAEKQQRFIEYQKTFHNFGQSNLNTDEFQFSMSLLTVASRTSDYLASVHALMEVYGDLSCDEDRTRVRPVIARELGFYSQLIESAIAESELNIAHTQMPGVAAEGARMRDDLREVKKIFDSIKLS